MKLNINDDLFKENLRFYMAKNNMTHKDFAHAIGLHVSTIDRYMMDEGKTPEYKHLIKICQYIGCSIDQIFCVDLKKYDTLETYSTDELLAELAKRVKRAVGDQE